MGTGRWVSQDGSEGWLADPCQCHAVDQKLQEMYAGIAVNLLDYMDFLITRQCEMVVGIKMNKTKSLFSGFMPVEENL